MCGATVEVAAAAHIAQVNSLPRLRVPHAILPRVLPSAHLRLRGDAELVLDHSAGSRVLSSERGQVGGEGTREGDTALSVQTRAGELAWSSQNVDESSL